MRAEKISLDARIPTRRLLLRPPCQTDVEIIASEINDVDVVRMLARVPFPYAREDAQTFLHSARQGAARGTDINLVIVRDDHAIGCIGLADLASTDELGYWLGRKHWRQGLATEAATAFLEWCFASLQLETVRSGAFFDNPASLHVQKKLGFEVVGASQRPSLARGHTVAHIDTILTRARFAEATQ
jgi:RimJ/RimL family protein N-acetyltransferase